jgi:tRNA threonylcarbamoyladenosine biosynthesis protein TsaE
MPGAEFTLAALTAWGEALGTRLQPPCVVSLAGDLGTGKTTLAQAIARGYGVTGAVTSPTFALLHEYAAPRSPVFHLDLYRLSGPEQLANIGWEDVMAARAVVLIEWPDRTGRELPAVAHAIELAHVPGKPDVRSAAW